MPSIFQILFPVFYVHLILLVLLGRIDEETEANFPKLISDKLELCITVRWQLLFPHCTSKAFWNSLLLLWLLNCIMNPAWQLYMLHHSDASISNMWKLSMRHIMAEITIANYQSRFLKYKSNLPCIKPFNIQNHREMRDTVSLKIPSLQFTISRHLIGSFGLLFLKNG